MVPQDELNHFNNARVTKELLDAGVRVQLGAHEQRESLGAHWELWMFQQGGMTPLQSLRAATLDGARYLGLDREIGSLETGKLADFIVLDANPLENVRNTRSVRYTIVNGRIYDAATMNEIGNHPRQRKPFFFQLPGNETWGPAAAAALALTDDQGASAQIKAPHPRFAHLPSRRGEGSRGEGIARSFSPRRGEKVPKADEGLLRTCAELPWCP